jgi:hypothetical protein
MVMLVITHTLTANGPCPDEQQAALLSEYNYRNDEFNQDLHRASRIVICPALSTCSSVAFDDDDFEITTAIPRSAAVPMDKVNEETRSKRTKRRSELAVIPAIRVICHLRYLTSLKKK